MNPLHIILGIVALWGLVAIVRKNDEEVDRLKGEIDGAKETHDKAIESHGQSSAQATKAQAEVQRLKDALTLREAELEALQTGDDAANREVPSNGNDEKTGGAGSPNDGAGKEEDEEGQAGSEGGAGAEGGKGGEGNGEVETPEEVPVVEEETA